MIDVTLNRPLVADVAGIDSGLAMDSLAELRAIVSGHAHYDHFIDVPHIMAKAPTAHVYTNMSGRHILAALAPDRPGCTTPAPATTIARSRVIAADDPLASHVDYTNCPNQRPPGAPLEGTWLYAPGGRVRLMPVCSVHPPQIGPIHFAEGSVDQDLCELPPAASDWLEGQTLAFVIDFLDTAGAPAFRVFYQDAPTDQPIGHVPAAVLAGKQVDVALLCVGSADADADHPTQILGNITPRYALSGHWEDFFQPAGGSPQPLPFLDLAAYDQRADAALPGAPDAEFTADWTPQTKRHVRVAPDTQFVVPVAP
jgi:hypothetical protein